MVAASSATWKRLQQAMAPMASRSGDFGNGHQDFAIADYNDNTIDVFMGDGAGNVHALPDPGYRQRPRQRDGRGQLHRQWPARPGGRQSERWHGQRLPEQQRHLRRSQTYSAGPGADAIVAGDFLGTGGLGLAVANTGNGTVQILPNLGDGQFGSAVTVEYRCRLVQLLLRRPATSTTTARPTSPWLISAATTSVS